MSATKSINHQPANAHPRSHAMPPATATTRTEPADSRLAADQRRWRTLAVLCLSLLMTVLDTTVVNVALPTLDRTLHASSSGLEWIVDAYTLVFAGLLMLGGALGDRHGRHRALPTGLVIFGVGSVVASLAGSVAQLIAARAVMGAGAALVMPATLSILTAVFTDPAERAKAIGIWSAVSGLGVALGPTLGGLLLEHFSWSSIFLINIPVVAVALIAGRRLVPASRAPKPPRIDIAGATLSVAGLSALTYTLIQAPSNGWTSASTIATGLAAASLLVVFVIHQIHRTDPLIDLRLFANPRFSAVSGAVMALFFALTAATFVLTQIYQFVLGYSPLAAGVRALAPAMMVAIAAPIGAKIAASKGPRLPITAGLVLATGGLCLFASASPNSGYLHYMIAMTFVGLGIGLSMAPATHSIMSSVPPAKTGVGSAINDTTRNLGGVLGVAIIGSIIASAYKTGLAPATAHLGRHLRAIVGQSVGLATEIGKRIHGSIGQQLIAGAHHAFVHAADHGLLIAAALPLIGAIVAARYLPGPVPVPNPARSALDTPEQPTAATVYSNHRNSPDRPQHQTTTTQEQDHVADNHQSRRPTGNPDQRLHRRPGRPATPDRALAASDRRHHPPPARLHLSQHPRQPRRHQSRQLRPMGKPRSIQRNAPQPPSQRPPQRTGADRNTSTRPLQPHLSPPPQPRTRHPLNTKHPIQPQATSSPGADRATHAVAAEHGTGAFARRAGSRRAVGTTGLGDALCEASSIVFRFGAALLALARKHRSHDRPRDSRDPRRRPAWAKSSTTSPTGTATGQPCIRRRSGSEESATTVRNAGNARTRRGLALAHSCSQHSSQGRKSTPSLALSRGRTGPAVSMISTAGGAESAPGIQRR